MAIIKQLDKYELFVQEARFFFCQDIYEDDWEGKEKYIVASDTPEDVLRKNYPEIMQALSPYFFCNSACGDVYAESKRNIDKFKKRRGSTLSFGQIEVIEDLVASSSNPEERAFLIKEALSVCTPLQRDRIQKYYLEGMTLREIANGKDPKTIKESIAAGIKRIQKFFELHPQKQGF